MGLPKAIDFSNLSNEQVFNADTKQYRLLNQIPDEQWGNYCNKMLAKGISVTYDATLDCFTAKPQPLKVKESIMKSKKQLKEWYDEEYFEKPQTPEFNANDPRQVKELCFLLSNEGIDKDDYPRWLIKRLENYDFIEENQDHYVFHFTEQGKNSVGDTKRMQKFLMQIDSSIDDSESKYLRGREEQMEGRQSKKQLLEYGDKVRFKDSQGEVITGTIQWMMEGEGIEVELPDGTIKLYMEELVKNGQKIYEANHRFKKALTEDEKRALLYDQDEDEELPEESTTEEDELESEIEDEELSDFDSEVNSLTNDIDEPEEEEMVDDTMNNLETKGISAPNVVSMVDLEAMLKKILGNNTQGQEKEQYPNGEAAAVQDSVPSLGQGPQANVLDTDFDGDEKLNPSEEDETLEQTYGHGSPIESEFADIKDKVDGVKNNFKTSNFDAGQPSNINGDDEEIPDLYNQRNDGYGEHEEYLTDDSDFERNAELAGGLGAFDTSEETGDVFEDDDIHPLDGVLDRGTENNEMPEVLSSVSGNKGVNRALSPSVSDPTKLVNLTPRQSIQGPSVNKTIQCAGMPIQIVLTGVMLTLTEVKTIAESVKKKGLTVTKIESKIPTELNIIIESNGRKYRVNYQDVDKYTNQSPFSIKHEKFQSLTEACERIELVSKQQLVEKKNFKKFNDKDTLTRSITNTTESNLLKEFNNKTNYISTWNVRSVGGINLKTGINESYSNITTNPKISNTLFKTKDGQFYLLKGNLNERSKIGIQKELVDLEGKKSYGVGKVVGIYENTIKGMGQIMYHTKRTSLPLLIWK